MRVLVTGGAGFIGHHIVEHLLETTDWNVVVLDGLTYAGRVDRLTDIDSYDPSRVQVLWHDLRAPIGPGLDVRIGDVDVVINAASDSSVDRSLREPEAFILGNIAIAVHMLAWARARGDLTHFIQISTDEVYGPVPMGRPSEEWDPILPSNPYSASKAAQEAAAIAYWRSFGVPVIITNTMNNFGERQEKEKFIPGAILKLLMGKPVTVHAAYDKTKNEWIASSRVWLHARNHADALRFIIENVKPSMYDDGALWPGRFNVAGEREVDVVEIVSIVADALDIEWAVWHEDYHASRPGHDLRYSLNGDELHSLGWKPPVPFEESLARTAVWTRDHRKEWLV